MLVSLNPIQTMLSFLGNRTKQSVERLRGFEQWKMVLTCIIQNMLHQKPKSKIGY